MLRLHFNTLVGLMTFTCNLEIVEGFLEAVCDKSDFTHSVDNIIIL